VWRGENTQRGRYREFMQCDFDIVGTDSAGADADIVLCIRDALAALDVGGFTIRINHRGLFNRFLSEAGVREKSAAVLRLVDKLEKIGEEEARRLLIEEIGEAAASKVLEYIAKGEGFEATLARMESLAGGPGPDSGRLRAIWAAARACGAEGSLVLDPSITRGLDYYTGVVFETNLDAMPQIGSVCSGGRYDELASLYTTRRLPGVGSSVGLDRLLAALEAVGRSRRGGGYTKVLVLDVDESLEPRYQALARAFRAGGFATEVFPEKKKLAQQFAYAERKGIPWAVLVGGSEAERGVVAVKDLATRESVEAPSVEEAVALVRGKLGV
jgi:histidyl-tRNA synthetase